MPKPHLEEWKLVRFVSSFQQTIFLFVMATLLAIVEIEAEGKYGWGEKFPTWYRVTSPAARLWALFNSKPLTGYHWPLTLFTIGLFFAPMMDGQEVTLSVTLRALSLYFAWVIVWDFSWFMLNPHYGLRKFRRDKVWWFAKEPWLFGRIPMGYIVSWCVSLGLAALASQLKHTVPAPSGQLGCVNIGACGGWINGLEEQAKQLAWYLVGIQISAAVITPIYHTYYKRMRRPGTDERHLAGIFPPEKDAV